MRLNELRDNPGAVKKRKRVGRGAASGKGKTAGRGMKGQKSRSGVALKGFEGGQMAIHRRLPKRGFNNIFSKKFNEVNISRIQYAIDAGLLDANSPINVDTLKAAGILRRSLDGVRILGNGELKAKISLEVNGVSSGARKAVEGAGGTIDIIELKPEKPNKNRKNGDQATSEDG